MYCLIDWAEGRRETSIHLVEVGDARKALIAIQESIAIYRGLFKNSPTLYARGLIRALNVLAICYVVLGNQQRALETEQESYDLRLEFGAPNVWST